MQRREDKMSGQGRFDGYIGSLLVTNFTYQQNVRILSNQRAQCIREGHANLRFYLDLVYSVYLVFDRIFDRDNLARNRIELFQNAVQSRCLARPGWSGDQDHPVWTLDQTL